MTQNETKLRADLAAALHEADRLRVKMAEAIDRIGKATLEGSAVAAMDAVRILGAALTREAPAATVDPLCPTGECRGVCSPDVHGIGATAAPASPELTPRIVRVRVDALRDMKRAKTRIRETWPSHDGTDRNLILDGYLLAILDALVILDAACDQ